MTNYTNYSNTQSILKETKQEQGNKPRLSSLLNSLWQQMLKTLIQEQDLKVWQSTDRLGNTHWYAYDPINGSSVSRDTEDEMRAWIEQRYHQ